MSDTSDQSLTSDRGEITANSITSEFINTTTIHGIPRVFKTEFSIAKVLWLAVIFAAIGGLGWHASLLIGKFLEFPTKVKLVLKSAERQTFPAVTVCNLNPAYKSKLLCTNFELATIDEHMTKLVVREAQNDTVPGIRIVSEPRSHCRNDRKLMNESDQHAGTPTLATVFKTDKSPIRSDTNSTTVSFILKNAATVLNVSTTSDASTNVTGRPRVIVLSRTEKPKALLARSIDHADMNVNPVESTTASKTDKKANDAENQITQAVLAGESLAMDETATTTPTQTEPVKVTKCVPKQSGRKRRNTIDWDANNPEDCKKWCYAPYGTCSGALSGCWSCDYWDSTKPCVMATTSTITTTTSTSTAIAITTENPTTTASTTTPTTSTATARYTSTTATIIQSTTQSKTSSKSIQTITSASESNDDYDCFEVISGEAPNTPPGEVTQQQSEEESVTPSDNEEDEEVAVPAPDNPKQNGPNTDTTEQDNTYDEPNEPNQNIEETKAAAPAASESSASEVASNKAVENNNPTASEIKNTEAKKNVPEKPSTNPNVKESPKNEAKKENKAENTKENKPNAAGAKSDTKNSETNSEKKPPEKSDSNPSTADKKAETSANNENKAEKTDNVNKPANAAQNTNENPPGATDNKINSNNSPTSNGNQRPPAKNDGKNKKEPEATAAKSEKTSNDNKADSKAADSSTNPKANESPEQKSERIERALKDAMEKGSKSELDSKIFDELMKPSIAAKDAIEASLLENKEFLDNFGSMMNAAKYKDQLLKYITEYNMNVYQAVLLSLQTEDLSDTHDLIYLTDPEVRNATPPLEGFLKECTFNGINCNLTEFNKVYNQQYGYCYTFNSGLENQTEKVQIGWGSQTGLRLTLDIESHEYVGVLAPEYGVRVSIHAPNELVYPQAEGFNVAPGQLTEIGVRYRQQNRLKAPYESNCTEYFPQEYVDKKLVMEGLHYTLTTCKMACADYYMAELCGCVQYRPESGVPQCYLLNENQTWCRINVLWKLRSNDSTSLPCPCTPPCLERMYTTRISTTNWPSFRNKQMRVNNYWRHNQVADEIINEVDHGRISLNERFEMNENRDLLRIHVYFMDLNYESIEEESVYEWKDLVADVGGILGLYVGMSLLAIIEILELFVSILAYFCCLKPNAKRSSRQQQQQETPDSTLSSR